MLNVGQRKLSHLFSLGVLLAFGSLTVGCATQSETSAVTEEQPPEAAVTEPAAPADLAATTPAAPPPKPISAEAPAFWQDVPQLSAFHGYKGGLRWRLLPSGIELEGATIEGHKANPDVIRKVWASYGPVIEKWSAHYEVPVEVVMTAVCVESKGNPRAKGGKNVGLMQLLVPTARSVLGDPSLTEESLYDPETNIRAGTAYIAQQRKSTLFDPPKVAAAYNAGSLRAADNRWGMRQYGPHLDKTVVWFNAVLAFLDSQAEPPQMSYAGYFQKYP